MPTYDYLCHASGQVHQVRHAMSESADTWGELCRLGGLPVGELDSTTPVERLATGGQVVRQGALKNPEAPPCASGGGCCGAAQCEF